MSVPTALELRPGGTRPRDVSALRRALARALAPHDKPPHRLLVPVAPDEDTAVLSARLMHAVTAAARPTAEGADVVLRTSGSTAGTGRLVAVSGQALVASAKASHKRLGGPGTWVLALPAHHVSGVQVLVRSLVAGTQPVVVDTTDGFDPGALADALERAAGAAGQGGGAAPGRVYLSLVPTQLHRCLAEPRAAAALARADAVLVGGAALAPQLAARAGDAGVRVVRTYGMSETAGGCVYDGVPLDGVRVRVQDAPGGPEGAGRIVLSGPVLAQGYLDESPADGRDLLSYFHHGPVRELVTTDLGRIGPDDRLEVLGRLDDVVISGGVKVDPHEVEAVLAGLDGVAQACVVGVPDEQWGQVVVAVVVPRAGARLDAADVRRRARALLDGAHTPRRVVVTDALPLRGIGKVDRAAVARLASRSAPSPATAP